MERTIRTWQSRLKLDHWNIKVDWDKPSAEGYDAECTRSDQYDSATLTFDSKFTKWDVEFATRTVVHELLHLHERDLSEAVKVIEVLVGKPSYQMIHERILHEREGLVDRLAWILVEITGEA